MAFPIPSPYLFAIALTLALLEIQIEGAHGWAEKLPTWRYDRPWLRRLTGKPLTGYHSYLHILILLFLHVPFFFSSWSWSRELSLLSAYFLLSVFWDFLWFVWNSAFGVRRFRPRNIWWFHRWFLGLPVEYWLGLGVSLGLAFAADAEAVWPMTFIWFVALTVACGILVSFRQTLQTKSGT